MRLPPKTLFAVLDALVAAGATAEMIVAVVKADLAEEENALAQRLAAQAARTRRYRLQRDLSDSEWQALRNEIISRDGTVCRYCGAPADPPFIDHMQPVSQGGKNTLDNLAVCCGPCNSSKRDKTLEEWTACR